MRSLICRLTLFLVLVSACASAQSQPVAGRDFQELSPPQPVSTGNRIEVIEFFYYGCPVCYEAQPHIARWLLKAGLDIAIVRVPAVSTDNSESFARTFYALGAMGQVARLHWPIYDNHHFDGRKLNEEENIVAWAAGNGVDAKKFRELRNSEEVTKKIESAKKLLDTGDVRGVPTFIIDGKYKTSARMAGGVREMIKVLDQLVSRARQERHAK